MTKTQRNNKQLTKENTEKKIPIVQGTRDAVESAIDSAKKDKQTSWDSTRSKIPSRVAQWEVDKISS